MAIKKGICKNFDNCSLADNNEIQEVDSTEFKCQECGKDLHELENVKVTPGKSKLPLIIAAAVVVLGGGGAVAYFGLNGSSKAEAVTITLDQNEMKLKADENATLTVTTTPEKYAKKVVWTSDNEAVATVESGIVKAHDKGTANITATVQPKKGEAVSASCQVTISKSGNNGGGSTGGNGGGTQTGAKNLGWANYQGPTQGGIPHGVGGSLKITQSYSIDLKDGRGSTLEVSAGETIENTKFENGRLRAGELHRADGTRKWFNI
ncbi:MAG: Ig-like domain-containing protein [Bacteroidales bacterium]|nr:Ig-like domain-containing protein [Bacteroidales bacterium]